MLRFGVTKVAKGKSLCWIKKTINIWNVKGYLHYKTILCHKGVLDV